MEGQGGAASAASKAGRRGNDPGAGAVVAAEFDDPGVSHVTSDVAEADEGRRQGGDDTIVIPAVDRPEAPAPDTDASPLPSEPSASFPPPEPSAPPSSLPKSGLLPPVASEPSEPPRPAHEATATMSRRGRHNDNDGPSSSLGGVTSAPEVPQAPPVAQPVPDADDEVQRPAPAAAEPLQVSQPPRETQPRESQSQEAPPEAPAPSRSPAQSHVRVDARLLEAALLNLRKRIAAVPLVFEISGSAEVKAERTKLLSQIDDYLLPRVRRSAAPILVALVGSTGAGKSTLVNSIVGAHVSTTGVRRPTTNSPVLACHPDDIEWFAENNFLPTLPRVRQEGLARPGRDGLLVLAASDGMPRGIALLDTPDIDSVVQAHHEFAYQFLDASDLWLFMTSASRYADGPVWEILQHARDRKASLGVVLSRIPQAWRTELVDHFTAMLGANGIAAENRFVIMETPLIDGMLPPDAYQPVRDWLADTAARADRRVAVLSQTMSGVLDTFKSRVPDLAAHIEAQVVLRAKLQRAAGAAYERAFAEAITGMKNGTLLRGEVLARWQDCVVGGDLRPRRGGKAAKGGKKGKRARRGPSRPAALNASLRSALESFIVSIADRAAEHVDGSWRGDLAGAALLADAAEERARGERAKQVFESVFGTGGTASPAADATQATALSRSSPDLSLRAARAIGAWQDHLPRLVAAEDARPAARRISFDDEALSLVVLVAMLCEDAPGVNASAPESEGANIYTEPRRLLTSVFGAVMLAGILAKARADLQDRVRLLLDEEMVRFVEVLDAAGPCDDVAAVRLYQAEYSLEAVR
jgi:energy-coupling factor transporter ATP-binding protein EcfA2